HRADRLGQGGFEAADFRDFRLRGVQGGLRPGGGSAAERCEIADQGGVTEMDLGLRDNVAVITGGTVGIGLAVAEGLAAEGANLVLVGRDGRRADEAAAAVAQKFGIIATAIAADVATAAGCDAVVSGTEKAFGGADILINNAGTGSNETIA